LDCPELDTPEGKATKGFVELLVNQAAFVTITAFRPFSVLPNPVARGNFPIAAVLITEHQHGNCRSFV